MKNPLQFKATLIAVVFSIFYLPAIFTRTAIMKESNLVDRPTDYMGGYLSGLFISTIVLLLATSLLRLKTGGKALTVAMIAGYLCLIHANYEHIKALGNIVNYRTFYYILDPTFFHGSALNISNYFVFTFSVVLPLILTIVFLRRIKFSRDTIIGICAAALIMIGIHAAFAAYEKTSLWRAYDVLHGNLIAILEDSRSTITGEGMTSGRPFHPPPQLSQVHQSQLDMILTGDLNAEWQFDETLKRPNILLIMIEGLSARLFPSISGDHDIPYRLSKVDSSLANFSLYKNYFIHSTQTNRGTYSLLCSDYPTISSANRASIYQFALQQDAKPHCIPQILQKNGYHTTYLQSANLTFMSKDQFLGKAGFDDAWGVNWFRSPHVLHQWGVDDRSFFEQSLRMIDELEVKKQPWFLTLLTSGTHHPYILPDDWIAKHGRTLESAYRYLDEYFPSFVKGLEERHLLDNTIIIVTSDEVHEYPQSNWLVEEMSRRWAPLFVHLPQVQAKNISETFMTNDVGIGLLDYLGLHDEVPSFKGRSIFRRYVSSRLIPFGRPSHFLGWRHEDGSVDICDPHLNHCRFYQSLNPDIESIYHYNWAKPVASEESTINQIKNFLNINELKIDQPYFRGEISLARLGKIQIIEKGSSFRVIGHQGLNIPANVGITVSFRIKVTQGMARLQQRMDSWHKEIFSFDPIELTAGQTYRSTYKFYTLQDYENSEFIVTIETLDQDVEIEIEEADFQMTPARARINGFTYRDESVF